MKLNLYKKHNSFLSLSVKKKKEKNDVKENIINLIKNSNLSQYSKKNKKILENIKDDLSTPNFKDEYTFCLNDNVIDELVTYDQKDIIKYLIHRYRYDI